MTWPTDILGDHTSASQLSKFDQCPEQWRQKYIKKQRERVGVPLIIGNADHAAYETAWRHKINTGTLPPLKDIEDMYRQKFDDAIEKNGGDSEIAWKDTKPGEAVDSGIGTLRAYYPVAQRITPIALEAKFSYAPTSLPVPIIGYIDVETKDYTIERKRANRKPDRGEIPGKHRIQGLVYRAVTRKPSHHHYSINTTKPYVITPAEHPTLEQSYTPELPGMVEKYAGRILRTMHAFLTMYGPDEPWPGALEHPDACNWCFHRPNCAWWAA